MTELKGALHKIREALKNSSTVVAQYNESAPEMSQDRALSGAIRQQIKDSLALLDEILEAVPDFSDAFSNGNEGCLDGYGMEVNRAAELLNTITQGPKEEMTDRA